MAKKKKLPRQKFKAPPKVTSEAEQLRQLKATPTDKLPEPPPMLQEQGSLPQSRPQDASTPQRSEMRDGIKFEYDEGQTTGYEKETDRQLRERMVVLLERLPDAIAERLMGDE